MRPGASTRFRAQRWLDHGRHGRRRRPGDPPGINGLLFWLPSAPGLASRSVVGARDQPQGDLPDQQVDRHQQQRDREHEQVADLAEGAHIGQLGVDGQAEHDDGARQEHAAQQHGGAAFGRGPRRSVVTEVRWPFDLGLLLARRKRHCEAEWYSFRYAATAMPSLARPMRRLLALGCLLLVGCAGPHSTGALWSLQNQQREAVVFSQTDAQRAQAARAYELSLADESLAAERARVEIALLDCPRKLRAMAISSGDAVRDSIRVRAQADAARLTAVAQVALADWRLRRARATGEARFCEAARAALTAAPTGLPTAGGPLLARLGQATVTRHPTASGATVGGDPRVLRT